MRSSGAIKAVKPACETISAGGRATSLAPMRPEGFAVPACVLNVVESFGCGGFLLDRERQLLFLNPTGTDCLGDGLTLRGKRVAATDRESDVQLQSLIETALNSAESRDSPVSVRLRRGSSLPLVVHIVRLDEHARPALKGASVLLVAFDPKRCEPPPPEMLTDLFGLTPAETSVALGIANGRHLAEIAAERGVKIETVRAHSKMVFGKTGTRGQAELAALLTRLTLLAPRHRGDIGRENALRGFQFFRSTN
jgi:DNA-binding CsgD family transcriptional regulator